MLNLKEKDKQKHFLAGIIVAGFLYPLIGVFAVAAAIIVGLIKEYLVDEIWSFGEPDIWDAVATALGGIFVAIVVGIAEFLLEIF